MTENHDEALAKSDYPKMDAEIKARWVKALRSGEYVQATGFLWRLVERPKQPIGNCCLGVLGRVVGLETFDKDGVRGFRFGHQANIRWIPTSYLHRINLDDSAENRLVEMNDAGTAFPEIADWIEQNL